MRKNNNTESLEGGFFAAMRQVFSGARQARVARILAIVLTLASIFSAIATYITITHSSDPMGPRPDEVIGLVLIDLVLLLALAGIITWRLINLWLARKRGSVGSRMQTRILIMFSMVSIVPTIIVAVFSVLFFNYGIQSWFDKRVDTALSESVAVAEGYLAEHKENIRADVLAMANDLNSQAPNLVKDPSRFRQMVITQAALRSLTEAIVFRRSEILAKTELTFSLAFEMEKLPVDVMERADEGEVVVLTNDADDRVRALIKLNNFFDTYLLVGRFVDSKVLSHMETTKGSADEFRRLKGNISNLQIQFSFVFLAVAVLLLFAALWVGIIFTGDLVKPVSLLIRATERVKAGDLTIRVEEGPKNDEVGTLSRAFNRMTGQLQKQRDELVEVNRQIDLRRRIIEAVLSGVTAGVLAVDKHRNITLFNRSALKLLSLQSENMKGAALHNVLPEVSGLLNKIEEKREELIQDEIAIDRAGHKSVLLVRIVSEGFADGGYIITFDDITELLTAQRSAAWADVARRIAHEVKNPLTPIQLSAERLKKKYRDEIKTDPDVFDKYIDTINRHVGTIGRIIEEFVNFARMPTPVLAMNNIPQIVRDAAFSQEAVNSSIKYSLNLPDEKVMVNCDAGQVTQVLTNLLKNSMEAIEGKGEKNGYISITLKKDKNVLIEIEDNGPGFPPDLIGRITEPYVTTREKGTGLGLAIVKKVMSDHGGNLSVANITKNEAIIGARVVLSFPVPV